MNLNAIIEGLLFVVGEDGLTLDELAIITEKSVDEVKDALMKLREEYENNDRGIRIHFLGNSFKLTTKKEHREYYQKLIEIPGTSTLSQAALETLAIIAYNEPITRIQVDEIRGISSSQMIRRLVAKNFIKEVGKSDLPGRPILYKTTSEFLDYFGLATIEDLPKIEELNEINVNDGIDLYKSKYQEKDENFEKNTKEDVL